MPNHVTTILVLPDLSADDLAEARGHFVNSDGMVDFNCVVPEPSCLKDFQPHSGVISRAKMALGLMPDANQGEGLQQIITNLELSNAVREISKPLPSDDFDQLIRAISNFKDCGFIYWYDWRSENWGTKWGAYEQPEDGWPEGSRVFSFQTAWSHPLDIVRKISQSIGHSTIIVKYADEDLGSNCGSYKIRNGEVFNEDIAPRYDDQSNEEKRKFKEFAFNLVYQGEDPASHGYDKNWEYSDEAYNAYELAN